MLAHSAGGQLVIQHRFYEDKLQGTANKLKVAEKDANDLRKDLAAALEQATKAEEEVKTLRDREKTDKKMLAEEIQKVVDAYERFLMGVGEGAKVRKGTSIHDSLKWLAAELDGFGDHMTSDRDYASLETLWAFCFALHEKGYDHHSKVIAKDSKHYWKISGEGDASAIKFFET